MAVITKSYVAPMFSGQIGGYSLVSNSDALHHCKQVLVSEIMIYNNYDSVPRR